MLDVASLGRAQERLAALGCRVKPYYTPEQKFQRFAAPDALRADLLQAAAADPEVNVVLALRGGYGMSRLLPLLDIPALAASGKLFCGYSDFTALHMALLKEGRASFSSPMISDDFSCETLSALTLPDFWRCLNGPQHQVSWAAKEPAQIDLSGTLWGGNLAMFSHLVGSPYLPAIEGGILFFEDIAEHPYRVERMLLQLHFSGILARQKAIVLGDFSAYQLSAFDNGYDFDQMLAYVRSQLSIPVITGLPFGHIRDKVTLVIGSQARLWSDADGVHLLMRDYPNLGDAGC